MSAARCVSIDGVLLRVSSDFDETDGSEDVTAARELVKLMRDAAESAPRPNCHSLRCSQHTTHQHGDQCSETCLCHKRRVS